MRAERRVPVEAVGLGGVAVGARPGDGAHGGLLAGDEVVPVHVPTLGLGEDDGRVGGVDDGEEAVAIGGLVPVLVSNAVKRARVGGAAPGIVVLEATADVVRIAHVVADRVELAEGQVVEHAPVGGPVPGRGDAAVAPEDEVVGVVRVDPECMMVDVDLLGTVVAEGAAAIVGDHQRASQEVDAVHVARVDPHLGVVHRTRVGPGHLFPAVAPVEGAEEAVLRLATSAAPATAESLVGTARFRLHKRVDDIPVLAEDIDADPSLVALGKTFAELGPAVAPVERTVDAASGTAPVEPPAGALALVHRGEDRVGVARVHGEVDRAGVFVDVQDLLPRLAPVLRSEDAAFLVRPPQIAHRRHVHDVRIARVDEDAPDVLCAFEPHVPPCVSGVGRLVDPVAPAGGLAVLRLSGAHPDQVRVRLVQCDVSNGAGGLVVEERRPGSAVVHGLPDPAGSGRDVEDLRLRLDDCEVGDAPAHQGRPDAAVLEVRDGGLEGGLGGGVRRRGGGSAEDGQEEEGAVGLHRVAPGIGWVGSPSKVRSRGRLRNRTA